MRKSLSRKFFMVYLVCVLGCIIAFSTVILVFSKNFFQNERYNTMQRNAAIAANITANNYASNNYVGIDEQALFTTFGVLSTTIGADFMLVDNTGHMIYQTNQEPVVEDFLIPEDIMNAAKGDGYFATRRLDGIAANISYIVGVPVLVDGQPISTVFVVTPAEDVSIFMGESTKIIITTSVIVLLFSLAIIYVITSRMVNPLRQMVEATHSFADGDFSKRIPVHRQDEIGQLSTAFNKMASALAVTESTRRSFVANVSHELKTPMTTIGGFVDGILDGTIPYEQQEHYLKIVSSEVKRLTRLVHSMLDTARIDAGEMQLNTVCFDISELVRQSIFSFEQRVEEKQITIMGLEIDKQMVFADRDLIHQVVYNLIENAVKFVDVGGEISVKYEHKDDVLYTTIRNTGSGLTKEETEQIFEQFYKSDRSRAEHTSGVGLGLHIVKSIINYHKGTIKAASVQDKYTEFTFAIAAANNDKKTIKSAKA